MNQPNTTPGLSLPSLSASESRYDAPGASASAPELLGARQEVVAQPQTSGPTYLQPLGQQPSAASPPTGSVQQVQAPTTKTAAPAAIDDDLDDESLDAEWVSKAKAIVEQTQSDPYKESRALSQVRAEYLLRRHGKEIKVHDAK